MHNPNENYFDLLVNGTEKYRNNFNSNLFEHWMKKNAVCRGKQFYLTFKLFKTYWYVPFIHHFILYKYSLYKLKIYVGLNIFSKMVSCMKRYHDWRGVDRLEREATLSNMFDSFVNSGLLRNSFRVDCISHETRWADRQPRSHKSWLPLKQNGKKSKKCITSP